MKRRIKIEVAADVANLTGESPIWSVRDQALFWVDIRGQKLQRLAADGALTVWDIGERIGAVGLRKGGGLVCTMQDAIYTLDLDVDGPGTFAKSMLYRPDLPADVRLKEGKVDARGRYWFGSTGPSRDDKRGALFCLHPDGTGAQVDDDYILPNGLAFSPDNRTMMVADSPDDVVYAYDLDDGTPGLSRRRPFFSTAGFPGAVDGATCDVDGGYWCAFIYDWSVGMIDPEGHLTQMVRLPVRHPTMCALGGPDLDTLYVTTAASHLKDGERQQQPLSGALFAIRGLGVRGVPEPAFGS